jgi:succinate dehydrogenase / fumarate reductase cytochrome b subunit
VYKGGTGMWMWLAHRTTGVAIFFFLLVHVTDTALVRVSPEAYNEIIGLYKNPVMGLIESGLVAAIVFHALNGLRIITVDVWERANRHQNRLALLVWILWFLVMAGFLPRHLGHVFGGQ